LSSVWWGVLIIKLLIMMYSPFPHNLIRLRLKYLPQLSILFISCVDSYAVDWQNDYDFGKNKTEGWWTRVNVRDFWNH
jgi:hypothetical protein